MLKENIPEKEGVKCRVLDFNPSLNMVHHGKVWVKL